jgi:hypothetical protein
VSTVRLTTNQSVLRLTPEGETTSQLVLHASQSVIKLSQLGAQGPRGFQGPPGADGTAQIPEVIDGGNF